MMKIFRRVNPGPEQWRMTSLHTKEGDKLCIAPSGIIMGSGMHQDKLFLSWAPISFNWLSYGLNSMHGSVGFLTSTCSACAATGSAGTMIVPQETENIM